MRHHIAPNLIDPGCLLTQNLCNSFLGKTVSPVFRENADVVRADEASPFHHLLPSDETSRLLGHLVPNEIDAVVSGNTKAVLAEEGNDDQDQQHGEQVRSYGHRADRIPTTTERLLSSRSAKTEGATRQIWNLSRGLLSRLR